MTLQELHAAEEAAVRVASVARERFDLAQQAVRDATAAIAEAEREVQRIRREIASL